MVKNVNHYSGPIDPDTRLLVPINPVDLSKAALVETSQFNHEGTYVFKTNESVEVYNNSVGARTYAFTVTEYY